MEGHRALEHLITCLKAQRLQDDWHRSLAVFHWMHASRFQKPNAYTYTNIIATLGRSHQVAAAKAIFDTMKEEEVERNIFHYNAVSPGVNNLCRTCAAAGMTGQM